MALPPIVAQLEPEPSDEQLLAVPSLADALRDEQPALTDHESFRPLRADRLEDGPALHLDDFSDIPLMDHGYDLAFMQARAILRAGDGDFVAMCCDLEERVRTYFRAQLGLGAPEYLFARPHTSRLHLGEACWTDRQVRRTLVHALRSGQLAYVHPHMGNLPVWQLAALLHETSRRPLSVIAPPPAVTQWVNDKIAFAATVKRLFGPQWIPRTEQAANLAMLSQRIRELAGQSRCLGLKLPNSAGGGGNVVLDAAEMRGCSLGAIRGRLKEVLRPLYWEGDQPLLIDVWESDVLCDASIQLWIWPAAQGPPVVEGIYGQMIEGRGGCFVGSRPARLDGPRQQEIATRSWLLARLFQLLGYVGRCSFDLILVGSSFEECRLEFIECNGRWGGTSAPMTLMNRLFGDWRNQPYANRECYCPGLERLRFADLLEFFHADLYDARSGRGRLAFYNPGRMQVQSAINVLALAETWEAAARIVQEEMPRRMAELVASKSGASL